MRRGSAEFARVVPRRLETMCSDRDHCKLDDPCLGAGDAGTYEYIACDGVESYCELPSGSSGTPTCKPTKKTGESCDYQNAELEPGCGGNDLCRAGQCEPARLRGQGCDDIDAPCAMELFCSSDGSCEGPQNNGALCRDNEECKSGSCIWDASSAASRQGHCKVVNAQGEFLVSAQTCAGGPYGQ